MNQKNKNQPFEPFIAKKVNSLKQFQAEEDQIGFNEMMENILPEVKNYLGRQLRTAIRKHNLPRNKYKVEDFIHKIYAEAFENIHEISEDLHLHRWLFKKADEALYFAIAEEDLEHTFFKDLNHYSKVEWESMQENFTMDADGDLVLLEELEELDDAYTPKNYTLSDVFVEDETNKLLESLSEDLTDQEIQKQIDFALSLLPFHLRTVFELSVHQQFDVEEIAQIKGMSMRDVQEILEEAKALIRDCFVKNHLNPKNEKS